MDNVVITLRLLEFLENDEIEHEVTVGTDEYEEFLAEKDLSNIFIDTIVFEDYVFIFFDLGEVSIKEFIKDSEVFESLYYGDVAYIGAYEEVRGIKDMAQLVELIKYGLFNYPFYTNMTIKEVAEEMVCEANIPFYIEPCIDYEKLQNQLIADGYRETEFGVFAG